MTPTLPANRMTDTTTRPKTKPWQRKNPKPRRARKPLTAAQKSAAKQRAGEAGRRYPNLVDNMWAAAHVKPGK